MKVVKNINNNVAICEDSAGNEAVVFAKGIGFKKPPYEIDIKNIERTFYDVDPRYFDMISTADEDIIDLAIDIKEYVNLKNIDTSSNLLFSLIDHISFTIERYNKGLYFNLPIANDIRQLFQEEMDIGKYALKLIEKRFGIILPKEEASYIALNIINSERDVSNKQKREDLLIKNITKIISDYMEVSINEDSVSYSRFVSHMHYLLRKTSEKKELQYNDLLSVVKEKNKKDYECAMKIKEYLDTSLPNSLNDDEVLFLTLHVNRLCQREV